MISIHRLYNIIEHNYSKILIGSRIKTAEKSNESSLRINESIFIQYLRQLRELIPYDPQYDADGYQNIIWLVNNSFPAHHNQTVQMEADNNFISN